MATISYLSPQVINDCCYMENFPEAASQSFNAGELVYLVSGKVTVCATDATAILGRALTAASGTTDTNILVQVFLSGIIVEMTMTTGGSNIVLAATHYGVQYGLYVASNLHYIDVADTTNGVFVILKEVGSPRSVLGDTNSRVAATVIDAVLQSATQ